MRISKALWISGIVAIGFAFNSNLLPAQASTNGVDVYLTQATEAENNSDSIVPYRGSGR
ncbi:MAG: heterocyst-inhibiting protein PatX [Geitlerinemataceae cyanobacterium]